CGDRRAQIARTALEAELAALEAAVLEEVGDTAVELLAVEHDAPQERGALLVAQVRPALGECRTEPDDARQGRAQVVDECGHEVAARLVGSPLCPVLASSHLPNP